MRVPRVLSLILAGIARAAGPHAASCGSPGARAKAQPLAADTPSTTVAGNTFIAPAGWTVQRQGQGDDRRGARRRLAHRPRRRRGHGAGCGDRGGLGRVPARREVAAQGRTTDSSDKDGWTHQQTLQLPDVAERAARRRGGDGAARRPGPCGSTTWRMPSAEKRGAQVALIFGRLLPKGYARETFAGQEGATRSTRRGSRSSAAFVETGQKAARRARASRSGSCRTARSCSPAGFGVRELGKPEKPDARHALHDRLEHEGADDAAARRGSSTEKKLTWDTPVTKLLPQFKLGDADTTSKVLVEHLICACTGLPRQDFEWLFEFAKATPESALATLGTMQPTSKFGEMFQYSNPLAAAAGLRRGARALPDDGARRRLRRGDGRREVFDPLGMTSTTFDFARALGGNHAVAARARHRRQARARGDGASTTRSSRCGRPAAPGAASRTCCKYVQMELAEGHAAGRQALHRPRRCCSRGASRRCAIGKDDTYGMGLMVDTDLRHAGRAPRRRA